MFKIKNMSSHIKKLLGIESDHDIREYFYFAKESKNYDSRKKEWKKQRRKQGFDERELWSLDFTIATFLYPRLIEMKKIMAYTLAKTPDQVRDMSDVDKAIEAMGLILRKETNYYPKTLEEKKEIDRKIRKGLFSLARVFRGLWY